MPTTGNWLDRVIGYVAPLRALRRMQARVATDAVRHYDAASMGRRTTAWRRSSSDANAATGGHVKSLRDVARDLVRNNPYAKAALSTIVHHVVGWGIEAKADPGNAEAEKAWRRWATTTACDADGRHNLAGLQRLVMRTVVESGEVLIRRRLRRPSDGLPIPLQLQVLDPDYIDTLKTGIRLPNGGQITHGIELDPIGRRVAYWLFPGHPGAEYFFLRGLETASRRIPAEGVLHIFRQDRPGQLRGASWFAPVMLRLKDLDEYEDATLMKQKVAACLTVITTDITGINTPLGTAEGEENELDRIGPGLIKNVPPGQQIEVVQPPSVREYSEYTGTALRAVAVGIGVTYEDITGDYRGMPYSAARMSRIRHWSEVEDWRWNMFIPQFCEPVWAWAMDAASLGTGRDLFEIQAKWTAPPMPAIEPDKEATAYTRLRRSGLISLSEALRERGYDPEEVFSEMAEENRRLDELGLVLDSDPRYTTQAGNPVTAVAAVEPGNPDNDPNGDGPAEPAAAPPQE